MLDYVVVKINTTGMDLISDRITEVVLIHMNDNETLEVYQQLLNPDIEITKFVENITGVTNDMVKSAPYINEVADKIISFIGNKPIVGHNINFDLSFLEQELNFKFPVKVMDTLRMSKAVLKYTDVQNFRLNTLCEHFDIDDTHERALKSAFMIQKLFMRLIPLVAEKKRLLDEANSQKSI